MSKPTEARIIEHDAFEVALVLKLINAGLEFIGGIIVFLVPPAAWSKLVLTLTQHELATDPSDFLANYFRHLSAGITISGEHFLGLFLISHGIIKLFLLVSLFMKKLWAYPTSIVVFSGFIIYQMYEFTKSGHYSFIALSVLDLAIVILTTLEYNNIRKNN